MTRRSTISITEMGDTEVDRMINWTMDDAGIVTLEIRDPRRSVNTVCDAFVDELSSVIDRLEAKRPDIRGVVLSSGHPTFMVGADLDVISDVTYRSVGQFGAFVERVTSELRRLETTGVPTVAAIGGSALGGGFEVALACHRRVMVGGTDVVVGLPEIDYGLLPGGGGLTRAVRMLGVRRAVNELLLSGRRLNAPEALDLGLVDAVVVSPEALVEAARDWILEEPLSAQPWDRDGWQLPGGRPGVADADPRLTTLISEVRASRRGAPSHAHYAVVAAAIEGAQIDFESAVVVERRYFLNLVVHPTTKNLIKLKHADTRAVRTGASRPDLPMSEPLRDVAVIGAGMMGAGIAYALACAQVAVHLCDIDGASVERGVNHSRRLLDKRVARGDLQPSEAESILARITPAVGITSVGAVDGVVEAVFESPELKAEILSSFTDVGFLASNTSTLPISGLSEHAGDPSRFIGLHFFSPVDRMHLVEIVVGDKTSPETTARAFDLVRQMGKTPIVVNDGRGFFTSRVIQQRLIEAAAMVGEGVEPISVERASVRAGYPTGTLALLDDVSLALPRRIRAEARRASETAGIEWHGHPGDKVLEKMVATLGRAGRVGGSGFYDYLDGRRGELWAGLTAVVRSGADGDVQPMDDLVDRLLFIEAIESHRCLDEGILRSDADGNVGSTMGIGFPEWTGGTCQFIAGYPGGPAAFVARADELADRYGPRFAPPASLLEGARSAPDLELMRS